MADYRILSAEEVQALFDAAPSRDRAPLEDLFEPQQCDSFDDAAAARVEDPQVARLFGEAERIYLDCNVACESDARADIEKILAEKGYTITSYKDGYATDAAGKQTFKIGKLLKDRPDARAAFEQDAARGGNTKIVISRSMADIAQMSTDRQWRSCMAADGEYAFHLAGEIEHGALVAYLISDKDPDVVDPLARITLKAYAPAAERLPLPRLEEKMDALSGILAVTKKSVAKEKADKNVNPQTRARVVAGFEKDIVRDEAVLQTLRAEFRRARDPALKKQPRSCRTFRAGRMLGLKNEAFRAAVESFVENELNAGKTGFFVMERGMYDDGMNMELVRPKKPASSKPFNAA